MPASPKITQPTIFSPTEWAQQVLGDVGAPVTANTTEDILAWMVNEEPTSSWWGGYGTPNAPTRLNPLNAGDIVGGVGQYGYHDIGLGTGGGLGSYNTLSGAASATAQMIGQGNMSGIKQALMGNYDPLQFFGSLQASPWASSHYAGDAPFSLAEAQAEMGGPNVTGAQYIGNATPVQATGAGNQPSAAAAGQGIAGILESQGIPAVVAQQLQEAMLHQQTQLSQADVNAQLDYLKQNYQLSQQQFGVQSAQLGLQGTQFQQQLANLQKQYGFQQQGDVLSGQSISRAISDIVKNYGIQGQQLGLQQTQARSGLASSGVYNTGSRGMEEQQFALQRQANLVSEQSALFQQQQAQKQLGLTEAEQKQQFGYSKQQIADGQAQLKLQYQSLGISEAQAKVQYNNAVQQIGLGDVMSGTQLEQQIAAMAGGGYSPLGSMMGQLANLLPFLGGMFTNPNQPPG